MLETSVKGQTLLLLLLAATPSLVVCDVKMFHSDKTLRIQELNGDGEVSCVD